MAPILFCERGSDRLIERRLYQGPRVSDSADEVVAYRADLRKSGWIEEPAVHALAFGEVAG